MTTETLTHPVADAGAPAIDCPRLCPLPSIRSSVWGALDAMTAHLATFTEIGDHKRVAETLDIMRGLNVAMAGLQSLWPI